MDHLHANDLSMINQKIANKQQQHNITKVML